MTNDLMTKRNMFHYLRNPYGADETVTRTARLQAADELERLYKLEDQIEKYLNLLDSIQNKKD